MTNLVRGLIPQKFPIAAHCSPLLNGNFSQGGGNSSKLTIAAHFTPRLHGNFSQGVIFQSSPIAAHTYMQIFLSEG